MPITKKHKSILFSGIALMAGATLLTGCASDPLPVSESEQYTRDFIKTFGTFDQSHDWNHATQSTVTVTTPAPTEVKIMADFEGKRYIFASYTNVEGTKTLNVDIPKGVSDLIVAANGKNYSVKAGGELNLRNGRAIIPEEGEGKIRVEFAPESEVIAVTGEYIGKYADILPEDGKNIGKPGVSMNFEFKNDGEPFIIYPVMWNTSQTNTLGIYYLDDNGDMVKQDIYTIKSGPMLQRFKRTSTTLGQSWVTFPDDDYSVVQTSTNQGTQIEKAIKELQEKGSLPEGYRYWPTLADDSESELNRVAKEFEQVRRQLVLDGFIIHKWETPGLWINHADHELASQGLKWSFSGYSNTPDEGINEGNFSYAPEQSLDNDRYESKGIKVTIPSTIKRFGMYISSGDNTFYSESKYNTSQVIDYYRTWTKGDDGKYTSEEVSTTPYNAPFAATFMRDDLNAPNNANNYRRVCFEDCPTNAQGWEDFNDMVFYIKGLDEDEIIEEPDPWEDPDPITEEWEWIIACEDLGTNDFDFNDVVFSVSYPKTEITEGQETKTVTVKALAAGGTLPVYLSYGNADNYLKPEGASSAEFHSWFGGYSSNHVINAAGTKATGMSVTIEVPADFTMSCTDRVANGNMGGFIVTVKHSDKNIQIEATNPKFDQSKNPELIGTAPQMICVPANWCWPTENTFILDVYEHFSKWCENPDQNEHWHSEANRAPSGYWKR